MLQRSCHRALLTRLPPPASLVPSTTCHVCTCRCGAPLNAVAAPAQRQYASMRRAPSTRPRDKHITRRASPSRAGADARGPSLRERLEDLIKSGVVSAQFDELLEFVDKTVALASQAGRYTADPVKFHALMKQYNVDFKTCYSVFQAFMAAATDAKTTIYAKKFLYTLSRAGSVLATLKVMHEALIAHQRRPVWLKSSEVQYARAHLAQIANQPLVDQNYRAVVLEGKVALALGDEERAIAMFTQAMHNAILAAQDSAANKDYAPDEMELSTPWVDLMFLYHDRSQRGKNEMDKFLWAVDIGCDQDDPTSHYYAAAFKKRFNADGSHHATSEWLFHMIKAAASGHQKAIHELAVFYAESGWKYLDEEPPNELKPTPFDSYPGGVTKIKSLWNSVMAFLGFRELHEPSPKDQLFHAAVYPSTAKERYALALKWLEINQNYNYAPSFLFAAQMLIQERLWGGANAPSAALQMTRKRYEFSSKENYEANLPISGLPRSETTDPKNPFYDLEKAQQLLVRVFEAYEAHKLIELRKKQYAQARRQGKPISVADEADLWSEENVFNWPASAQRWVRFPEVKEMYEDQIEELYLQAKAICDEKGWDLLDDHGGMVYRAKATAKAPDK